MTDVQTNGAVEVVLWPETTRGVSPAALGGIGIHLRITDSPGLQLKRNPIKSNERRRDGNTPMRRLGSKVVDGSYNGELTVGGAVERLLEAVLRSTWGGNIDLVCNNAATFTSLQATTTSRLTLVGSGSFLTSGFKVGDVVYCTGLATAANNYRDLRVTAVADKTMDFAGTPFAVDGAAANAAGLHRRRKLISAGTPVRRTFSFEQYNRIMDQSELFKGCRVVGFSISVKPDAPATFTVTLQGIDRAVLVSGTSPYFTQPGYTVGDYLTAQDGVVRFNGTDVTTFTGFDLNFTVASAVTPVIGSSLSPDVHDNDLDVDLTLTGMRSSLANIQTFDSETEFEVTMLLEEHGTGGPTAAPQCLAFYLSRVKIGEPTSPAGGGDGPQIETLKCFVGPKVGDVSHDSGYVSVFSSSNGAFNVINPALSGTPNFDISSGDDGNPVLLGVSIEPSGNTWTIPDPGPGVWTSPVISATVAPATQPVEVDGDETIDPGGFLTVVISVGQTTSTPQADPPFNLTQTNGGHDLTLTASYGGSADTSVDGTIVFTDSTGYQTTYYLAPMALVHA